MKMMKMIPMLALVWGLVGSTVTYASYDFTIDNDCHNWSFSGGPVIAGKAGQDVQATCRVTNAGPDACRWGCTAGGSGLTSTHRQIQP